MKSSKIDFVVAGAQKSGTTAFDLYLREHPEINMPVNGQKELHFFDFDERYMRGEKFYHNYFSITESMISGEITPIYMYWNGVLPRLKSYNPDLKIILLLRNPVDRAFSHWNMEHKRGNEIESFEKAIEKELYNTLLFGVGYQHRFFSYVARGRYASQLKRIYQYFPVEQVLALNYSDFVECPNEILQETYKFLGVPSKAITSNKQANNGNYDSKIKPETRQLLLEIYKHEVEELERMLGWSLGNWLS